MGVYILEIIVYNVVGKKLVSQMHFKQGIEVSSVLFLLMAI